MSFIQELRNKAKKNVKKIVLPEGLDERTLRAADFVIKNKISDIILLGKKEEILKLASSIHLENIQNAEIIDPENNPQFDYYVDLLLKIRGKKIKSRHEAEELVKKPLYLATLLVKDGQADGEVAGAENTTGDVLRPAFQIVKTTKGVSVVSGAFFMVFENKEIGTNGIITFADCAVHPNPDAKELAEIAIASAHTTRAIAGFEPKVALLSFSTKGSGKHEMVDKVVEATRIAKQTAPEIILDGELQVDAAIIPEIAAKKAPGSKLEGNANVLVFPTLETGNISYKLVQRLAGAEAVGPVLQGMAAPINDLSRGCSTDDIINMVAITSLQASGLK